VPSLYFLQYFSALAGIIAGNGEEYRGVAPGALIVNAKAMNREGIGSLDDAIPGIMWAVGTCNVDIVNMSLGSGVPGPHNPQLTTCLVQSACTEVAGKDLLNHYKRLRKERLDALKRPMKYE
jgi:hypothetical protein